MALICIFAFLLILLYSQASNAVHGVTDECCNLAMQESAHIVDPHMKPGEYKCGQVYSPDGNEAAAPNLSVPLWWCNEHCNGYDLYKPDETNAWVLPLIQFILPAVIFSMAIPRGLALKPLTRRSGIWFAVRSLFADAAILILDVTFWVFTIMIAPAPFMRSGLLDFKVRSYTSTSRSDQPLNKEEGVEALTAVLAGNLGIESVPANPQKETRAKFREHAEYNKIVNRLLSMLTSQSSFGGVVGENESALSSAFSYSSRPGFWQFLLPSWARCPRSPVSIRIVCAPLRVPGPGGRRQQFH